MTADPRHPLVTIALLAAQKATTDVPEDRHSVIEDETLVEARITAWLQKLPRDLRSAIWPDIDATTAEVARRWLDEPQAITLLLLGSVGTGKTWTATAVAGQYLVDAIRRHRFAVAEFAKVPDLAEALHWDRPRAERDAVWHRVSECELLVLDDLTAARSMPGAREVLWRLIDHRVSEGLRIVVTANAPDMAVIADVWGEQVADRLVECSATIEFTGPSRRRPLWVDDVPSA